MPDEPAPLRRYFTRQQICGPIYPISTRTFNRLLAEGVIPAPDRRFGDTFAWSEEAVAQMGLIGLKELSRRRLHLKLQALPAADPATDQPRPRGRRPRAEKGGRS
jgi:hypothetical protein